MRRSWPTRLLFAGAFVLAAVGVARIATAWRRPGLMPPCLVIAPPGHHHYEPGCSGEFRVSSDRSVRYRFNSLGLREAEEPGPGPHVLVVGDSDVEGHGLESAETLPAQLQARFPKEGRFVNGGIRFSGPIQQRLQILRLLPAYKPRKLLWVFCENDLLDDRLFEALATKRGPGGIPEEFSTADFDGTEIRLPKWARHEWAESLARWLRNEVYFRNTQRLSNGVAANATHSCAAVRDVLATLRAQHVDARLIYLPLGPNRAYSADTYAMGPLLECLAKEEGFTRLDHDLATRSDLFFAGDTHLNAAGVRWVVDELAKRGVFR